MNCPVCNDSLEANHCAKPDHLYLVLKNGGVLVARHKVGNIYVMDKVFFDSEKIELEALLWMFR